MFTPRITELPKKLEPISRDTFNDDVGSVFDAPDTTPGYIRSRPFPVLRAIILKTGLPSEVSADRFVLHQGEGMDTGKMRDQDTKVLALVGAMGEVGVDGYQQPGVDANQLGSAMILRHLGASTPALSPEQLPHAA